MACVHVEACVFCSCCFPSACDFTSNKSLIINYLCVTGTSFTSLSLVNSLTVDLYQATMGGTQLNVRSFAASLVRKSRKIDELAPGNGFSELQLLAVFMKCQRIDKAKASKASPCHTEVVYN